MTWMDWAIVIVLLASVVGGLAQGFFRTACSLIGLIMGLALAAWNYHRIAALVIVIVRIEAVANAIGFLLIAVVVMALANFTGRVLGRALHWLGLGCLDRLGGGALGFLQGMALVMLVVLVTVAFFPGTRWVAESRLPRKFFGSLHVSMRMSPAELAERVQRGLSLLEQDSPEWMHPGNGPA